MAIAAVDHAGARGSFADSLALVAGMLLLVLTIALCAALLIDVIGRYGAGQPVLGPEYFEVVETYVGPAFAAISLLALPAALAANFGRRGDAPLRARSALALVPGCPLALAGAIVGLPLLVYVMGLDLDRAGVLLLNVGVHSFASYVMLFGPIIVMLAAVLGGAGSPEATAAVAAPTILIWLFGIATESSVGRVLAAMLVPLLLTLPAYAALYAIAPARAVTPWLLGTMLPLAMALPIAYGFLTPTETAGVLVLVGLVIAIPVRVLALGQAFKPVLRQAATETVALMTVLLAASVLSYLFAYLDIPSAITKILGPWEMAPFLVLTVTAAAVAVLSYLLTPAVTLGVGAAVFMPIVRAFAFEPIYFGAIAILLGLAAVAARSGRREAGAASLTPSAAWIAAGIALALAVLVALLPSIALWLATVLAP